MKKQIVQKKNETKINDKPDSPISYTKHIAILHKGGWWLFRESLVIIFAILLLATIFVGWKLYKGPIALNFLAPHIEQEFNNRFPNLKIKLGGSSIIWQKENNSLNLRTSNIELYEENKPLLVIKHADIGISLTQAITGKLRINSLSFTGLAFKIHRDINGEYKLVLGNNTKKTKEFPIKLKSNNNKSKFISSLSDIFSNLKRISLKETNIVFEDILNSQIWQSNATNAFFIRNDNAINGSISTDILINYNQNITTNLKANIYYDIKKQSLNISTIFQDINPNDFAKKFPKYPVIKYINMPLSGKIDLSLNNLFELSKIDLDLFANKGDVTINKLYKEPITIADLKAKFSYIKEKDDLTLEQLSFYLPNNAHIHIVANSSIANNKQNIFVGDIKLTKFPIDDLKKYWPSILAPPARKWVTNNLSVGYANNASLSIAGVFNRLANNEIELEKISNIDGQIEFENIDVTYLKNMPKVKAVSGSAKYNKSSFNIVGNTGYIDDIKLKKANVKIANIGSSPNIDINIESAGTIKTALTAIKDLPFMRKNKLAFNLDDVSGKVNGKLNFTFPLKRGLKTKDVKISINSILSNTKINNIFSSYSLKSKSLNLKINNKNMQINGLAQLSDMPLDFHYLYNFSKEKTIAYQISGDIKVNEDEIKNIVKLPPHIFNIQTNALPVDFTYTKLKNSNEGKIFIDTKLRPAQIDIPILYYRKDKDKDGSASMFVHIDSGGKTINKISSLTVKMPKFKLEGDVQLAKSQDKKTTVKYADIKNLTFEDTQLAAILKTAHTNKIQIELKGPYIDISPILKYQKELEKNINNSNKAKEKYIWEVLIDTGYLSLFNNSGIHEAKFFIKKDEWGNIDRLEIDGITGKGEIYYRYQPTDTGHHNLVFEANDAGAALKALGISSNIVGGNLTIKGAPIKNGKKYDIAGRAVITDFTVVNLPILARLLNSLSPTGLQNLLSGEGISFSKMKANFKFTKSFFKNTETVISEIITIKDGKTSGSSLGLTFEGTIDKTQDILNINGTIVPISGLNKAIGEIPIIGDILTGGSDAVFAATYYIKGPKTAAEITVNPLAALAPGFLRMLFFE